MAAFIQAWIRECDYQRALSSRDEVHKQKPRFQNLIATKRGPKGFLKRLSRPPADQNLQQSVASGISQSHHRARLDRIVLAANRSQRHQLVRQGIENSFEPSYLEWSVIQRARVPESKEETRISCPSAPQIRKSLLRTEHPFAEDLSNPDFAQRPRELLLKRARRRNSVPDQGLGRWKRSGVAHLSRQLPQTSSRLSFK